MIYSTDFPQGLSGPSQYLSAQHHLRADLQGSVADIGRYVIQADYSTSLKEIICSLLAGRGLKLPNIQLCLFINIQELLGLPSLQSLLAAALGTLAAGLQKFLDHTRIEDVLSRINNVLAEITSIANMINFCSSPIDPVAIPNLLEQGMQSFLGAGQDLMNRIGTMVPSEIGGCITPGSFNCSAFDGGILGRICDNIDAVSSGTASIEFINAIQEEVDSIVAGIDELVDNETGISGTYDTGGSDFIESARPVNDTIGVLHNGPDSGIQGNTQIASQLKALYDNLGSYQVVGNDGTVYNNIFETFVEPDLLNLLRRQDNPIPTVANRQPVFNYCGEIVGYTEDVTQEAEDTSGGVDPDVIDQPGYNASGLVTSSSSSNSSAENNTVNNITNVTNISGTTQFVDTVSDMLSLDIDQGILVYVTETNETYVRNGESTGTIADYNLISGLGDFLAEINNEEGDGFLIRSGDTASYRTIKGVSSQIVVANGSGVSGNPTIQLADNPIIPGNGALRLPTGVTSDRIDEYGNIRYNTQTTRYEGFVDGTWKNFAFGEGSITDGSNIGNAPFEIYKQVNNGVLEFRTLDVSGAISASVANNVITLSDSITTSNTGSGAQVSKGRTNNNLEFRSLEAGNGIGLQQTENSVIVSTSTPELNATVQTTDATETVVPFSGITPANNTAWFVTVQAVAKRTNGAGVTSIKLEGLVDNSAGVVSIVGTAGNRTVYNSTPSTANYDLKIDSNLGTSFSVSVIGDVSHDVNWAVKIVYQQV